MGRFTQYFAMLAGSSWVMMSGVNLGWTSPYLPILESYDSPIGKISTDDAFWCSVMPLVGAVPGALLAGAVVDKLGRKNILVGIVPICILCFLAIAFTTDLWVIDVARFVIGTTEGATYAVLPMYFGEIAEPCIRGAMSSSINLGAIFGLLIINILGPFTSIFTNSLIMAAIPMFHFFAFMWLPESPYYLIKVNRLEEAKKSLERLRSEKNIHEEYTDIAAAVKRQESDSASFTDLFTKRGNRKAVGIYLILAMANKFSGANPIVFYTQSIFSDSDGILEPATSVIIFHTAGFISIIFATCTMDKFGRRPLMIGSEIGCGFSLGLLATYLTLKNMGLQVVQEIKWIPLMALISYYSIFNLGICLGPVVFLSELFPTSVKGYALGAADSTSVLLGTIASKIFHGLSLSYGMHVPFWLFSAMCTIFSIAIYFFVPETKGKSLEEIQLELTNQHPDKNKVELVRTS